MHLPALTLDPAVNYVGAFLTLGCNLNCSYCINDPGQAGARKQLFPLGRAEMPPVNWVHALGRLPPGPDRPITLQGGEPTLYWRGRGLGAILEALPHRFDLLTNLTVPAARFAAGLRGQHAKLQRPSPYPSIRVSYHSDEMEALWQGRGFDALVENCAALGDHGFRVDPDKRLSDVGIYVVDHPDHRITPAMRESAARRVPLESKPFLGVHDGALYGDYRYPYSTDLISRGFEAAPLACDCRTSELLIDPLGFVWRCHAYLYRTWVGGGPKAAYAALEARGFRYALRGTGLFAPGAPHPAGHILDPDFEPAGLRRFSACGSYGTCIGCDTKVKNDRFQSLDDRAQPHTSVEIRNIDLPDHLLQQLPPRERARIEPALRRNRAA